MKKVIHLEEEELAELCTKKSDQKCVDLNFMVFNYGRFHNNVINQLIHIIFVPVILYTWYISMSTIGPFFQLSSNVAFFGDKIGAGIVPYLIVSTAYFFVDW